MKTDPSPKPRKPVKMWLPASGKGQLAYRAGMKKAGDIPGLWIPTDLASLAAMEEVGAKALFNYYCNAYLRVMRKPATLGSKKAFLALSKAAIRAALGLRGGKG